MIKNKLNKYIGALTIGMAVMAIPSCTDDHFTAYEDMPGTDPSSTKTLWEQICSQPNLTKFRSIAEKAQFYRDDVHPVEGYTYADILKSNMVATVWAPEDEEFDDATYDDLMNKLETKGYDVHAHFMGNHIAMFRYNLNGDSTLRVKTLNQKKMDFNKKKGTFQGLELAGKNIPARNGILHTIKGIVPFKYNFYQFMKFGGMTKEVSKYLLERDTTYFSSSLSIEGLTDSLGRPTYVDSVYFTTNRMLSMIDYWPEDITEKKTWLMPEKGYRAQLEAEDSSFVMIIPTDEALAKAKDKLAPFYNYATAYSDESTFTEGKYVKSDAMLNIDAEKVAETSMMMDILTPTVFNIHKQYTTETLSPKALTMEEFNNHKAAKYYYNTWGDTIRSTKEGYDMATLFTNADTVRMSNGYVYLVNEWNFPVNYYKPNIYVELTGTHNLFSLDKTLQSSNDDASQYTVNPEAHPMLMEAYGKPHINNFLNVVPSKPANKPWLQIPLYTNTSVDSYNPRGEVMSGEYDIYMVRVPVWYTLLGTESDTLFYKKMYDEETGEYQDVIDSAYVDSISNHNQSKFDIRIAYNNNVTSTGEPKWESKKTLDIAVGKKNAGLAFTGCEVLTDAPEYKINAIDTILIAKNFKFPYSYKNIRSNKNGARKSYPILEIKSNASATDMKEDKTKKTAYSNYFCIDRIILVSKETGFETPIIIK